MATFYVDYEGGNDSNDGLSFTNRKKTLPSANTAASPGDTIRIMASPTPTSIGNATWTNQSKTVTLASALTKNISLCETAWTAAVNVTTTTSTTRKEGSNSTSIAIAAAFVTGQVAREVITATDFSAYKQVSFWIRTNAAIAASTLELRLCSDTLGLTTVNTIPIPAIPNVNLWTPITYDTGGTLGASIQSIVLQALVDPGTVTILLDNILACKDSTANDAITLNSMLGKNTVGETWWAIQSINGTTVLLDANPDSLATVGRGYYGATETVTTYKLSPIKTDLSTATSAFVLTKSGSYGSPITFSGGWNRTDMSTQTSETHFTGQNGSIEGIRTGAFDFLSFDLISLHRYSNAWQLNGSTFPSVSNTHCNNNTSTGFTTSSFGTSVTTLYSASNGASSVSIAAALNYTLTGLKLFCGLANGAQLVSSSNAYIKNIEAYYNASRGIYNSACFNIVYENLTTGSNVNEGFRNDNGMPVLINPNLSEATPINNTATMFNKTTTRAQKYAGNSTDNRIYTDIGIIQSVADADRHSAGGLAWKFSPTSASANADYPLALRDCIKVACAASTQVTISVWVKRTSTGLTARLFLRGGQIAGVPSDVITAASGSANVYEQISISFTPTAEGVVDIELQAYGGTTFSAWFDDMTIVQL